MKLSGSKPRPWVKLWREERGRFAQLPLFARALDRELHVICDEHGVIDVGSRPHADAVAFALGADRGDRRLLRRFLPMLEEAGRLRLEDGRVVLLAWQAEQAERADGEQRDEDAAKQQPEHDGDTTETRSGNDGATTVQRPCNENQANHAEPYDTGSTEKRREEGDKEEDGEKRDLSGDVRAVFEYWREKLGKTQAAKLDPKRRRCIERALAQYGSDGVRRCIDGYAASAWHRGENDRGQAFDDLTLWLRDAERIERGIAMADGAGQQRRVGRLPPVEVDADSAADSQRRAAAIFGGPLGEVANG